jgi:zinc/manganese transport system ATP-binding protein
MTDGPVALVDELTLRVGDRTLWEELSFGLEPGELLAVLGANGAGKTSLLRVLLGLVRPTAGRVVVDGTRIGYIPHQRAFDEQLPLRGVDLVGLGLDGHRYGLTRRSRDERERVARILATVGASAYARAPVGRLSGGEQQRLRIAQALVSKPRLVLADEPLSSLDLRSQRVVVDLLDAYRRETLAPLVLVTHDVNPVLHAVTRVLYLADGRWAIGDVAEVMTSQTLSRLYGAPIDVLRVRGRIVVVGGP